MLITIKPLKANNFQVDIDTGANVMELKRKVALASPLFPMEQQKLIYRGRILQDDDALVDLNIEPEHFIVVMLGKVASKPSTELSSRSVTERTDEIATASPQAPSEDSTPTVAAIDIAERSLPAVITDLKQNPRYHELAEVVSNDPAVLEVMLPALRPRWTDLLQAIQENRDGFLKMLKEEICVSSTAVQNDDTPGAATMRRMEAMMMAHRQATLDPNFRQFSRLLAQDPARAAMIMQNDPELARALQGNRQAAAAMNEGAANRVSDPPRIGLLQEDHAAIDRLVALGFDRTLTINAYLACGKNEEAAANALFDGRDGS